MADLSVTPRLPRSYYAQPTSDVARDLLGRVLVRQIDGRRLAGRIVETEAYGGPEDRASHATAGPRSRAAVMWGPPGIAYVYLIYGLHHCLNPVTEADGIPGAVLIRALEPIAGIDGRTDGPGRLCRALAIDRGLNREPLDGDRLWIEAGEPTAAEIATGPRVGVDFAGEWAHRPLRFWIAGNPFVSRPSGRAATADSPRSRMGRPR